MSEPLRILLASLLAALALAAEGDAYAAVIQAASGHPNRLPGSTGWAATATAVETTLRGARLEPHRLGYRTLVQRTRTCRLVIDGVEIPEALALDANGAAPPSTWGRELSGPAVWLDDGSLEAMRGKTVAGCIAFVRLGATDLSQVFGQGAKAVVAVGGEEASQWQAVDMFSEAPVATPRAWIPSSRASAIASGQARTASLRLDVRWDDVATADLWTLIPAASDAPAESAAQTIVLAAELATSGVVPEASPGGRQAANAALLTELAVRLAGNRPQRNLLVVFLGSHRNAQDGARMLYWTLGAGGAGEDAGTRIAQRITWVDEQLAVGERRGGVLAADDLMTRPGDDAFWLVNQLRRVLSARVNNLNYRLRDLNLARKPASERKDAAAVAEIDAAIARLKAEVAKASGLRQQMHAKLITDQEGFSQLRGEVAASLASLQNWLKADAADLASARLLASACAGKPVIAHFGIDFANAAAPWFANPFTIDCHAFYSDAGRLPQPGFFARHSQVYQQAWDRIAATLPGAAPLRSPDASANFTWDALCTPRQRQTACAIPLGQGLMASQLVTLGDSLDHDEMPSGSTPDLLPMSAPLAAWLREITGNSLPLRTGITPINTSDDRLVWRWNGGWSGLRVDRLAPGSEEVQGPAAGALLMVQRQPVAPVPQLQAGRTRSCLSRVNPVGYTFLPLVADEGARWIHALDFDDSGAPSAFFDGQRVTAAMTYNIRIFTGSGSAFYTPFLPADYLSATSFQVLSSAGDSAVRRLFGGSTAAGTMVMTDEKRPIKLVGNGLFLLGASRERPQGVGIAKDPATILGLDTVRRSAEDGAILNRSRLELLRSRNLVDRNVERVNAGSSYHLDEARKSRESGDIRDAAAHETFAAALTYRAQRPLSAIANDLLQAVVWLLALSIPFAFALERLVVGAVSIYRQIMGFFGFFLATFAILYFTHPAFALAGAPLIIFLAFVIIVLSAFVISVVMGKFKHEVRAMQGLESVAHKTGSGGSTTLAAVIIGIAGMRNRPLKTFLTAGTVTLLTFTILVFTSFRSGESVQTSAIGRSRGAERIEVHLPSFLRLPERLADSVETMYGDRFTVVRRSASFRDPLAADPSQPSTNVVLVPATGRAQRLDAMLGLDPREAARLPAGLVDGLAGWRPGEGPAPLWLSTTLAERLAVTVDSEVRIRGQDYRLAGTFAPELLRGIENIDGSRLTPPDFTATFAAAGQAPSNANFADAVQAIDATSFVFSPAATTAITVDQVLRARGGFTNTLVLYPSLGGNPDAAAQAIAGAFNGPVYSTSSAGSNRHFYTRELSGSGHLDVIVPILLGGLIIFSSLLGSIVDRQKEIFTYSALGLSPRDVATLFFAESSVLAVIGGMGGYLLAQGMAKVLEVLANQGMITVPEMSFSSLSSLLTIAIVMLMVLLSTIYPAMLAGRSANPGVNRSWRMPKPNGDNLDFVFPFTVPEKSFGGIIAFIREHFRNHGDAALDVFAAREIELKARPDGRMEITAEIALAPFDLGVYQHFTMSTRNSDIPGIDEVVVSIRRLNGAPASWMRGNRAFISDLREQFLIWRSLSPEAVTHYQAEAAAISSGGAHVHG